MAVSLLVQSLVCTALRLLKQHLSRYGGYIGAYLVLGGIDKTGPHLFTVHAHGSSDSLPYVTMGEWGVCLYGRDAGREREGRIAVHGGFNVFLYRLRILGCNVCV